MKILRYRPKPDAPPAWGWLDEDRVGPLMGSPFGEFRRQEAQLPLPLTYLLPPVEPTKIVCVGRNFAAHAAELDAPISTIPVLTLKPPSAVVGPGESILIPPQSKLVQHAAELAVVLRTKARWVAPEQARSVILGFTAANDITARDLVNQDGQWTRAKSFDTFCPLGPWIETDLDPADTLITCSVNGVLRQMASTRDMLFQVPDLVAFISSVMTLEPGDVILTGSPAGVGQLMDGDEVSVEIEGVGKLTNPVRVAQAGIAGT